MLRCTFGLDQGLSGLRISLYLHLLLEYVCVLRKRCQIVFDMLSLRLEPPCFGVTLQSTSNMRSKATAEQSDNIRPSGSLVGPLWSTNSYKPAASVLLSDVLRRITAGPLVICQNSAHHCMTVGDLPEIGGQKQLPRREMCHPFGKLAITSLGYEQIDRGAGKKMGRLTCSRWA